MQTPATLQRTLQALFINGISIFALAPAFAADTIEVTANNYVRAESDFQMRGYKDVPVDGFWSVTLYDDKGWMPVNKYNAYSFNNVTAKKDEDGSISIHFGGDPRQPNFLPIVPGWNYIVRLYQPKKEIRTGIWQFPAPELVKN